MMGTLNRICLPASIALDENWMTRWSKMHAPLPPCVLVTGVVGTVQMYSSRLVSVDGVVSNSSWAIQY